MKDKQKEIMKLMAEKGFNSFDDLSERLNNFPEPSSAKDIEDKLAKLINPQPLFTLTAEEVEIVDGSLEFYIRYLKSCEDYCKEIQDAKTKIYTDMIKTTEHLLTRIKQWQDENNKTLDSER